mgnify:CR=1 FL=1
MSWTKRIQRSLTATLCRIASPLCKALCQMKHCKKMHLTLRKSGLTRPSTTVLLCSKELAQYLYRRSRFYQCAPCRQDCGRTWQPCMMLYTGLDCHENGKFEDAFTWFTKGAALGQSESIAELADYYYHFYDAKIYVVLSPMIR